MKGPKVSVIIPNYNHAPYLRQRIESVLHQTYKNLEVIILDDCSSDGSKAIIETYRDHPLVSHIVYNSKNSGSTFLQWKRGLAFASGDWLWFAESDDYAENNFIELLIQEAAKDPSLGLIYCDSKIVTETGIHEETFADLKNQRFHTGKWSRPYHNNGMDEIEEHLFEGGTINNSSAVLFKKAIFEEADPFDLPLKYTGDKYAFLKVLAKSNIAYRNESLNYYRNPFGAKRRAIFYAYEQFLIGSWAYHHLPFRNRNKFFDTFFELTSISLFRDWDKIKLNIFLSEFKINPKLFLQLLWHNLVRPLKSSPRKN